MKYLSRREEIVLAAIWKLQGNAYGMAIMDNVSEATGYKWLFGSVYTPISRLLEADFITGKKSEPTTERGGRGKVFYELTGTGKEELIRIKHEHEKLWVDVPSLEKK